MTNREYRCDRCGMTFISSWSEEEAEDEYRMMFGGRVPRNVERAVLCDDCWDRMFINPLEEETQP